MVTTTKPDSTAMVGEHGAIVAADAEMFLHRFAWDQAIVREAGTGQPFTADVLQSKYDLPDIGNATGGVFMAAHKAGTICRVGYRCSGKRSRAGGVVAIWKGHRTHPLVRVTGRGVAQGTRSTSTPGGEAK